MAKRRKAETMAGASHGPLAKPSWVNGRRVIYLHVPFADKDRVKALGAKWNPDRRQWWIFADLDDRSPVGSGSVP